jgi:membrane protease YdiL (CAAX protease family)
MIQRVTEIGFLTLVVVGIPLISWMTARDPQIRTLPRRSLYLSAALSEWIFAALAIIAAKVAGLEMPDVGFRALAVEPFAGWTATLVAISAAGLGGLWLLEQRGWWPDEPELVYVLLPRTASEKAWALLLVAPTAALAEEFLFRGYVLAVMARLFHSEAWAWGLQSAAFGLAHGYQRPHGAIRAAALGLLLAWPVVRTGNLYPSIVAHFLIDATAFAWLGPRMLKAAAAVQGGPDEP